MSPIPSGRGWRWRYPGWIQRCLRGVTPTELATLGLSLRSPLPDEDALSAAADRAAATLAQRLAERQMDGGALAPFWTALHRLIPHLSTPQRAELAGALDGDAPASVRRVVRLLSTALAEVSIPGSVREGLAAAVSGLDPTLLAGVTPTELATLGLSLHGEDEPAAADRAADALAPQSEEDALNGLEAGDVDELYIANAGLAMLWPFLPGFFEGLGLLADRQFVDGAAAQRGVGLLHYAATGERTFPEYVLALNKVLCGMDPTDLVEVDPPLTDEEVETCDDLLRAVIVQAPILGEMTVSGLRGTFLLRPGVLRVRDGAWLLQVERMSYDLVLDRFPWTWQWVRLPWMEMPLRVEW